MPHTPTSLQEKCARHAGPDEGANSAQDPDLQDDFKCRRGIAWRRPARGHNYRLFPGGARMTTVACLAGDGVGPELMAAATQALDRVAKLHAFELDDVHLPFAGEAVTRSGHPLPSETRTAYRDADAILVASPQEPAFEGVKADLQLAWRIARVHLSAHADVVMFAPLGPWANDLVMERAFACAASRRGRVAAVGSQSNWLDAVERERVRWDAMETAWLGLGEAIVRLKERPEELDVIVTEPHLREGLV